MPTSDVDPHADEPVLLADHISAGYGGAMVVHDVVIGVGAGEVIAVIGPNGAGKSTALKAIIGTIRVSEGAVYLRGKRISGLRSDQIARLGVGYVPQERDVFPKLTVTENLEMGGYAQRPSAMRQSIDAVLSVFPALADLRGRRAGSLSGGERKMLAVGRVLMTHPRLILLDEPTASLSPTLAKDFLQEHVARLASGGTAVLIVEQRAMEALTASARGYLMVGGKIALAASSQSLLERDDIGELFLGRTGVTPGEQV